MALSASQQLLFAETLSAIPGSTVAEIKNRLYAVIKEFLDFSNVWYENITVNLVPNQLVYTLIAAEVPQGELNRLLVYYNPNDLPDIRWADRCEFQPQNTLRIATTPSQAAVRVARMGKWPNTFDAEGMPDLPGWVYVKYWKQFAAGLRRDFALDFGKPWANPAQAVFWGKQFHQYKSQARIDAIKSNVLGQINWSYPTQVFGSQRGV